jgi:hypothetical protein
MTVAKLMGCESKINTRKKDDFYETPSWVTEQLCAVEQIPRTVWEPSSGHGAITRVLQRHGVEVVESDLLSRVGQRELNFLAAREPLAQAIVTNPPFNIANQYVRQAYRLGVEYVALLLKIGFFSSQERQKLFEDIGHPTRVWALADRPDFLGQGAPCMDCGWFVWEGWHAPQTIARMIPSHIPGRAVGARVGRKKMVDLTDTLKAAERTAARLLCEHPNINLADKEAVIDACLSFKVDLRRGSALGYAYENVKEAATFQRQCAAIAAKSSWSLEELHREARQFFDPQKGAEEQLEKFYRAQAQYRLVKVIRDGHQSQPQNLVA